ncbi:MAG: GlcG/HbpS family heme-binding protein [Burkholderiales bacterium]
MSRLTLKQANTIINEALAKAGEMKIPPLTLVVLDDSGHIVAVQRQDGATMFRFEIALGKAWGAVAMGASSRSLARRAKENPNFFGGLIAASKGQMVPQPGGALIKDTKGNVLGAIGASGGAGAVAGTGGEDEACCVFGIGKAGLVADVAP